MRIHSTEDTVHRRYTAPRIHCTGNTLHWGALLKSAFVEQCRSTKVESSDAVPIAKRHHLQNCSPFLQCAVLSKCVHPTKLLSPMHLNWAAVHSLYSMMHCKNALHEVQCTAPGRFNNWSEFYNGKMRCLRCFCFWLPCSLHDAGLFFTGGTLFKICTSLNFDILTVLLLASQSHPLPPGVGKNWTPKL